MPERRAGARGGGLDRADSRSDGDFDRRPVAALFAIDQLEDQRREPIDPGVARRDQCDRAPLGREIERQARPLLFGPDCAVVTPFTADRASEQVEIEAIANDVVRFGEQCAGFRRPPGGIARTDADHREMPARPAGRHRVDRCRCARDRAGRMP